MMTTERTFSKALGEQNTLVFLKSGQAGNNSGLLYSQVEKEFLFASRLFAVLCCFASSDEFSDPYFPLNQVLMQQ